MRAKTLRTAAAVLVVLGLVTAAAPAAAAPAPVRAPAEAGIGPALFHHLAGWLTGLWPRPESGDSAHPAHFSQSLGSSAAPDGKPASGDQTSPDTSSEDDPTAEPQLGPVADPGG